MTEGFNWGEQQKNATTVLIGDYPVVFAAVESKQSSNGKPQLAYTLKITSGQYVGRVIKGNITFSPENPTAVKMFFVQMAQLGFDETFFQGLQAQNVSLEEGFNRIAAQLQGLQITAELENRRWNEMDRESVKAFKRVGGAAIPTWGPASAAAAVALPVAAEAAPAVALAAPSTEPPADPF